MTSSRVSVLVVCSLALCLGVGFAADTDEIIANVSKRAVSAPSVSPKTVFSGKAVAGIKLTSCPFKYEVTSAMGLSSASLNGVSLSVPSSKNNLYKFSTTQDIVPVLGKTITNTFVVKQSGTGKTGKSSCTITPVTDYFMRAICKFRNCRAEAKRSVYPTPFKMVPKFGFDLPQIPLPKSLKKLADFLQMISFTATGSGMWDSEEGASKISLTLGGSLGSDKKIYKIGGKAKASVSLTKGFKDTSIISSGSVGAVFTTPIALPPTVPPGIFSLEVEVKFSPSFTFVPEGNNLYAGSWQFPGTSIGATQFAVAVALRPAILASTPGIEAVSLKAGGEIAVSAKYDFNAKKLNTGVSGNVYFQFCVDLSKIPSDWAKELSKLVDPHCFRCYVESSGAKYCTQVSSSGYRKRSDATAFLALRPEAAILEEGMFMFDVDNFGQVDAVHEPVVVVMNYKDGSNATSTTLLATVPAGESTVMHKVVTDDVTRISVAVGVEEGEMPSQSSSRFMSFDVVDGSVIPSQQ